MSYELNPEQKSAAQSTAPITVCISPPGSGKTSTASARIQWLLDNGASPQFICAVTFTNSGARALSSRLNGVQLGHCGTLHSLMLRLLQSQPERVGLPSIVSVMDEETAEELLQGIAQELCVKVSNEALKQAVLEVRRNESRPTRKEYIVAKEYHRRQRETGALDFDNVLIYGLNLLKIETSVRSRFKHLLCDEQQDAGIMDNAIYNLMECQSKFYVGDFFQSIYSFRGAHPENLINLSQSEGVTNHPLTINYRSGTRIIEASQNLISHSEIQLNRKVEAGPDALPGYVQIYSTPNAGAELANIAQKAVDHGNSMAVLFRTNHLANEAREYLQGLGLVTTVSKTQAAGEKLGRIMLATLINPWSDQQALRLVKATKGNMNAVVTEAQNKCCSVASLVNNHDISAPDTLWNAAGFQVYLDTIPIIKNNPEAWLWLLKLAQSLPEPFTLTQLSVAAADPHDDQSSEKGIHVGTYHSSKGLEWDSVCVCGAEEETISNRPEELEESRRLFYVACTRARHNLFVSWTETRQAVGRKWIQEKKTPSRFIAELSQAKV